MTEDERLDEQVEAQQEGDAEKAAALADKGHGYPPHVIEPAVVPEDNDEKPAEDPGPADAIMMDDMAIQLLRLASGEWILGQFKEVRSKQEPDLAVSLAFHKVFRFGIGANQQGQIMPQLSPWPAVGGTLDIGEITGQGVVTQTWGGLNVADIYRQAISPIQQATARQAQQAQAQRERAQAILDAGTSVSAAKRGR